MYGPCILELERYFLAKPPIFRLNRYLPAFLSSISFFPNRPRISPHYQQFSMNKLSWSAAQAEPFFVIIPTTFFDCLASNRGAVEKCFLNR